MIVDERVVCQQPFGIAECPTYDVQMILNYPETRGDIDVSRVGMFGEGAAIAVLAAVDDKRMRAIDLLNPWVTVPIGLPSLLWSGRRTGRILDSGLPQARPNDDPIRWLPA